MAVKERINPKTGKKEYKVRYYFVADGKKKDSETGWFPTVEKAEKEAKRLKEIKELADANKITQRRDKMLGTVYQEFADYYKTEMEKGKTNTDKKEYTVSNAIRENHMKMITKETRIKDLSPLTWKNWLSYINSKDELGGGYVRLCRLNLIKFNSWLSNNGYYVGEDEEELYDTALRNVKLKSSMENNKERDGKRRVITVNELLKIGKYYIGKEYGLGDFRNFYFYTLFYTLFFSGMRVEELTGLQWKFIDLRDSVRTITIKNSISKLEDREMALERTRKEQYRTKNKTSVRTIPIFDFYYELLIDYKESFKYQYGLTKEEIEECFVFPNIDQNNPFRYMRSNQTLRELKKALEGAGIDNTDLQMFRHSCATFLILPPPEGLGMAEERVKDYFGHQDTQMLNKVYAKLSTIQKADRMRQIFSDIYSPSETDERTKEEKQKQELLDRLRGGNEHKKEYARKMRIESQIKKAFIEGRIEYRYSKRDSKIVESVKNQYEPKMKFIMETE